MIFKAPSNPKPPRILQKVGKENVQAIHMSHELCKATVVNTQRTNNCIFFEAALLLQLVKINNPNPSENNAMHMTIHLYLRCERQGRKQQRM